MNNEASKNGPGELAKRIAGWIGVAIGFITGVVGFFQLVKDETELVSIILLMVGVALLWGSLFYIRFKKTTIGKALGHPRKVHAYSNRARFGALVGIVAVPLLVVAGFMGWKYYQNLPSDKLIVLVANFDGPDQKYGVTETILSQLRTAVKEYEDVEIQSLDEVITAQAGSSVARARGEDRKAGIVLWGWYRVPRDSAFITVHFEVLKSPIGLARSQKLAVAELENFQIQTRLSNEMSYLTLLTLGLARYEVDDYDGAIDRFTGALDQPDVPEDMVDPADIYFYRGNAYFKKGDYDRAMADYDRALALSPDLAIAYLNRGLTYRAIGDPARAAADFSRAEEIESGTQKELQPEQ